MEIYFTFSSTSWAIKAEKLLLNSNILVKVRPLPALIKSGCGIVLSVSVHQQKSAQEKLSGEAIEYTAYSAQNGIYVKL